MSERDVYNTPEDRVLLRTKDVYQTESQDDVASYSDRLLSIVADFANSGAPEGFNAQSMVGKSKRGEVACRLFARIDPATGIVEAAGFKTRGCLAMTGCASAACQLIEGKPVEEALQVKVDDVREFVDGVPAGKVNALHFAACAVQALVGDFLIRDGAPASELQEALACDPDSISCIMAEHCSYRQSLLEMRMAEAEERKGAAESDAVARCLNLVRENTRLGRLTKPSEWDAFVPDGMLPAELAEKVLSLVAAAGSADEVHASANPDGARNSGAGSDNASDASDEPIGAAAPAKKSRFANRGVGVPSIFGKKAAQAAPDADALAASHPEAADDGNAEAADGAPAEALDEGRAEAAGSVLDGIEHVFDYGPRKQDDDDFELVPPEGYKLVEVNGQWGLVETDEPPQPKRLDVDASGIEVVEGADGAYLYDGTQMTGPYAHWAFLAVEGDPVATFACCVRDESRIYPRPMAASDFANDPLRMGADAVDEAWEKVRSTPGYEDIRRTQASNGDAYFYSARFLDDDHAASLAEWSSVERFMNV